jgi:hypothetical protein
MQSIRGGGQGASTPSLIIIHHLPQKKLFPYQSDAGYDASIMKEKLIGLLAGLALGISLTLVFQSKNTNTSRYQIIPIEPTPGEEQVVRSGVGVVRAVRLDTVTGETFPLEIQLNRNSGGWMSAERPLEYLTTKEWLDLRTPRSN